MLNKILFSSVAVLSLMVLSESFAGKNDPLGQGNGEALSVGIPSCAKRSISENGDSHESTAKRSNFPETSSKSGTPLSSDVLEKFPNAKSTASDMESDIPAQVQGDTPAQVQARPPITFESLFIGSTLTPVFIEDLATYIGEKGLASLRSTNKSLKETTEKIIMERDPRGLERKVWVNGPHKGTFSNYRFNCAVWQAQLATLRLEDGFLDRVHEVIEERMTTLRQATQPLYSQEWGLPGQAVRSFFDSYISFMMQINHVGHIEHRLPPFSLACLTGTPGVNCAEREMAFFSGLLERTKMLPCSETKHTSFKIRQVSIGPTSDRFEDEQKVPIARFYYDDPKKNDYMSLFVRYERYGYIMNALNDNISSEEKIKLNKELHALGLSNRSDDDWESYSNEICAFAVGLFKEWEKDPEAHEGLLPQFSTLFDEVVYINGDTVPFLERLNIIIFCHYRMWLFDKTLYASSLDKAKKHLDIMLNKYGEQYEYLRGPVLRNNIRVKLGLVQINPTQEATGDLRQALALYDAKIDENDTYVNPNKGLYQARSIIRESNLDTYVNFNEVLNQARSIIKISNFRKR